MNPASHPVPRLALFLKAPRLGAVKTRLAASLGPVKSLAIYRQMVERQICAMPPGWPVTIYYDPPEASEQMAEWLDPLRTPLEYAPQCSGNLGVRLAAAFATEFARTTGPVVALGGDCPGLDGFILESARSALESHDVALGPANDGGYYLIGLNRAFPTLFADIPWSTPQVLSHTWVRIGAANLTSTELPPLDDVDDVADWQRAVAAGRLSDEPPRDTGGNPSPPDLPSRLAQWKCEHAGTFLLNAAEPGELATWLRSAGILTHEEFVCSVTKAGEGNMNCTVRVATSQRSFIVKQARPWVEKYPHFDAPWDRALREMEFYRLAVQSPVVAAGLPRLLHCDQTARLLVLEDLGQEGDYSDLYRGAKLRLTEVGALAAWLSALHGAFTEPPVEHRGLTNHDMRALNSQHIFFIPFQPNNGLDLDAITPGLGAVATQLQSDPALAARARELAAWYLADGNCLLHGDYFPGSFLRTPAGPHLIDPEFAHFGHPEFDPAVLLAHLHLAGQPGELAERFLRDYQRPPGFDDVCLRQFTGIEILRRLLGYAQLPLAYDLATKTRLLEFGRELVVGS